MRAWTVVVGGLFLAGCFSKPADVDWDAPPGGSIDGAIDTPSIDAMPPDAMVTPANLTTTATPHNFGDVTVGQQSSIFAITIRNSGEQTSGTLAVSASDATDFEVVPTGDATDCDGQTLTKDETCVAQVRFSPQSSAALSGTLDITASPGNAVSVDVNGMGLSAGNLTITAGATLTFANTEIGAMTAVQTMTVHNGGGSATASLTVSLSDTTNYTKVTDGCGGAPLGAGASCSVDVRFDPTLVGSLPAQLSVRESVNVGVSSAVSGTGSARIALSKTGTGTVMSSPGGISCGTGCSSQTGTFTSAPISFNAGAATGFRFGNWTGACSGTVPDGCSITPTQGLTSLGATFVQTFDLTVSTTGGGTIASAPSGISCGNGNTMCSATYDVGTTVTLTADPDNGGDVYAWTGIAGCAQGAHTCQVDMTQVRNVAVEFRPLHTLSVTIASGGGTVNGAGITCPGTCSASYFEGTVVPLGETPDPAGTGNQTIFGGWSGACTGAGSCSVTMSADEAVSAAFTLQYQVSVTIGGTGSGSVAGPGGFACASGTCSHFYDSGSSVTLTASAGASTSFIDFSGDCSGSSCGLTMSAARTATATFHAWDCTPSTIVCDPAGSPTGQYTSCDATGHVLVQMDCPVSCATGGVQKCLDVNPSNGLAAYLDMTSTAPDIAFSGSSTINTDTAAVFNGSTSISPPTAVVAGVRIFMFDTLSVAGTLRITGSKPVAFVVNGDVTITGTIDLGARTEQPGAGGSSFGSGLPACTPTTVSSGTPTAGGGGGGHVSTGARGGASGNGTAGSIGSSAFNQTIVPLTGGCAGGSVLETSPQVCQSDGGAGGGGIQITSRTKIAITGSGKVDASGGGGGVASQGCSGSVAGAGGGAGGSVLLEAPQVLLDGAGVVISTKGGGGAAAGNSQTLVGADGGTSATAAAGGAGSLAHGGNGGVDGTTIATAGAAGAATAGDGGGGGGSAGETRFNTSAGTINPQNGAAIRSASTAGALPTRQIP